MSLREHFPDYFSRVPGITVYDPLAELLGAPADGLLRYQFSDAVRLAGHACPTVASAWLATTRALARLYPERLPQRGNIGVALAESEEAGVAGVIASVAGLVTGAAGNGGFMGLGGRHGRRDLLRYGVADVAGIAFTRLDSGRAVDCRLKLDRVASDPALPTLLAAILDGSADAAQRRQFAAAWQDRVRRLLVEHADDPALVDIRILQE